MGWNEAAEFFILRRSSSALYLEQYGVLHTCHFDPPVAVPLPPNGAVLLTRSAEVWTYLYELNTYDVLVDRVARERPDEHSHQDDDVGKVGAGGDKQAVEVIGLECVVVEEETDDGQDLWERERERKKIELNIR